MCAYVGAKEFLADRSIDILNANNKLVYLSIICVGWAARRLGGWGSKLSVLSQANVTFLLEAGRPKDV